MDASICIDSHGHCTRVLQRLLCLMLFVRQVGRKIEERLEPQHGAAPFATIASVLAACAVCLAHPWDLGPTLDRRIVVPRSDPSVSAAWATVSLARGSKVEGRSLSTTGV